MPRVQTSRRLTWASSEKMVSSEKIRMVRRRLPPAVLSPARATSGRTVLSWPHMHTLHILASGGSQGLVVGLFKYALRRGATCSGLGFVSRATCCPHVSLVTTASYLPSCLSAVRPPRHHRRRLVIHFGSRAQITCAPYEFQVFVKRSQVSFSLVRAPRCALLDYSCAWPRRQKSFLMLCSPRLHSSS